MAFNSCRTDNQPADKTDSAVLLFSTCIQYQVYAGTFNMPTSYQEWVWEREAHFNWSMVTCQGSTRLELP